MELQGAGEDGGEEMRRSARFPSRAKLNRILLMRYLAAAAILTLLLALDTC